MKHNIKESLSMKVSGKPFSILVVSFLNVFFGAEVAKLTKRPVEKRHSEK